MASSIGVEGAQRPPALPSRPSGLRRITPPMLAAHTTAEQFDGTEATSPGQILAAFKAAAPYLGFRPTIVHAVDWLFQFTQPQDWQPGARPIVWPSAALQREALGLGPSQAKSLNRVLAELRLVVMRDSPNGKRYGRCDPRGRIVEAYGFDLSPLGERQAEFQAIAEAGRAERAEQQALRRRATIARNGLRQIMETAAEAAIDGLDWQTWQAEAAKASRGLARLPSVALMAGAVATLERVQKAAREALEAALARREAERAGPVNIDPKGPENRPHITPTNQLINPPDTVMALKECKSGAGRRCGGSADKAGPRHGVASYTGRRGEAGAEAADVPTAPLPHLALSSWTQRIGCATTLESPSRYGARLASRWAGNRRRSRLPSSRRSRPGTSGHRLAGITGGW